MSNETRWTQGPWQVCEKDHGSGWGIDGPRGEVAVWWPEGVIARYRDRNKDLEELNSELCEALEDCLFALEDSPECDKARAALAKARGEQS